MGSRSRSAATAAGSSCGNGWSGFRGKAAGAGGQARQGAAAAVPRARRSRGARAADRGAHDARPLARAALLVPRRAARRPDPDRRDRPDQGDRPLRPVPRRRADDLRDAEHHRRDQAALPRPRLVRARPARPPGAERPAVASDGTADRAAGALADDLGARDCGVGRGGGGPGGARERARVQLAVAVLRTWRRGGRGGRPARDDRRRGARLRGLRGPRRPGAGLPGAGRPRAHDPAPPVLRRADAIADRGADRDLADARLAADPALAREDPPGDRRRGAEPSAASGSRQPAQLSLLRRARGLSTHCAWALPTRAGTDVAARGGPPVGAPGLLPTASISSKPLRVWNANVKRHAQPACPTAAPTIFRMRSTPELREAFLSFFESKGHLRVPSAPLIPRADDRSTLLTTAGMQPQMPYFLGREPPPAPRTTTVQKCFRTPDIDEVGLDGYHCTFFEMLGNFSFGQYFKDGAVEFAWEFVFEHLKIEPERFWVSVFAGDPELGLDEDEVAVRAWERLGQPPERIVRLPASENFWSVGGPGPCGPDSEMYYDRGEETGCGRPDCAPGCACERFLEFWNLVFMEFELHPDGKLTPLPKQNIDTGLGLERTASILQGVISVYETDGYQELMRWIADASGVAYGDSPDATKAHRVLADHGRGMTFLVADGVTPSNEGRGYVLRR